jgi:hypothetical protein
LIGSQFRLIWSFDMIKHLLSGFFAAFLVSETAFARSFVDCNSTDGKNSAVISEDADGNPTLSAIINGKAFPSLPIISLHAEEISSFKKYLSYEYGAGTTEGNMVSAEFFDSNVVQFLQKSGRRSTSDFPGNVRVRYRAYKSGADLSAYFNCGFNLQFVGALKLSGYENFVPTLDPISDKEFEGRVDAALSAEEANRRARQSGPNTFVGVRNGEPVVVVYGERYGVGRTVEFVPASRAPFGSEPVVAVAGYHYGVGTEVMFVPASQAPFGSVPVVVREVFHPYAGTSYEYVPVAPVPGL